jgi:hypothetical protein
VSSNSFASVRSAVSNPPVNQARATGEVRLDDEIRPYEAERLAVFRIVVVAVEGEIYTKLVQHKGGARAL